MAGENQPDSSWAELEALDENARQSAMRERFTALVGADAGSREQQMTSMIHAEYSLEDQQLHAFTVSRLRAWMSLAGENLEHAQVVAGAWDEAFKKVPGAIAMRRAGVVQTVARDEFTADDIDVLFELIPSLVGHLPRASQQALEHAAEADRMAQAEMRRTKKPWWKFW